MMKTWWILFHFFAHTKSERSTDSSSCLSYSITWSSLNIIIACNINSILTIILQFLQQQILLSQVRMSSRLPPHVHHLLLSQDHQHLHKQMQVSIIVFACLWGEKVFHGTWKRWEGCTKWVAMLGDVLIQHHAANAQRLLFMFTPVFLQCSVAITTFQHFT